MILSKDKELLTKMWRSTKLVEHLLSTCRTYNFIRGLGYEKFWGYDLRRYRYFWLPPQNFLGFDCLEDLVSCSPIKFIPASSIPLFHKCFYSEHGPPEYELSPSPLED